MPLPAAVVVSLSPSGPVALEPRAPFLRADDVGVLRGDGVFERFLVRAGRPRHFEDHLERLERSGCLTALDVPPREQWRQAVAEAVRLWTGAGEWELRLVCTRGPEEGGSPTAYVLGQELTEKLKRQRRDGVSVLSLRRGALGADDGDAPWLLLGAKTLSYAVNLAAKRYAQAAGAEEAIFVGAQGEVFEGPTSAVVAAFGPRLVSPPPSIGILNSISTSWLLRGAIERGWQVSREQLSVDDLFSSDGVWLSSSLNFARVRTLDGKAMPDHPAQAELAALALEG
jgi:4-amino-4-deoxychorismate lyase